jgi:hypothetical protein
MVKPKVIDVRLEDYFYVDSKGVLKWKIKYGKMRANDRAGKWYTLTKFLVCFRGHYYPAEFLADLLIKSGLNAPPVNSVSKVADSPSPKGVTRVVDPQKTYMTPTAELRGLSVADTRQVGKSRDIREILNSCKDLL